MDTIRIRGARTHNLKNVDLDLPRDRLIVITGLSGSGKSSLAFDTIYAEGQRRYVESLSAYARQFLSVMEKPDVDHIEGLSPAISIEQKTTSHNPRSTVGTITEIYDYLRLLFARVGAAALPGPWRAAGGPDRQPDGRSGAGPAGGRRKLMLLAPVVSATQGRAPAPARGTARPGFRARPYRWGTLSSSTTRRSWTQKEARHRSRDRSLRGARRPGAASGRILRDRAHLSGGLARVGWLDEAERPELTFSARFACPSAATASPELEPRIFSFNNPAGACPTCDGLGIEQFFDPAKVVVIRSCALAGGAIRGWDRRNAYYFQMLRALGEHYGFDAETPWLELTEQVRSVILYGSGKEKLKLKLPHENGSAKAQPFEGIVRNMERRYRETESSTVREELARYLSHQPCPACQGSRLNEAARHVFVGEHNLPAVSGMPVGESLRYFETLELPGKRGEIGSKITKEIATRLRFLVDVGLDYLTLERSAETLSGGEAQRIRLASQIGAGLVGVMYILDEPSIGLHQRDNARLLKTLTHLRDIGNTVIVVEHDEEAIRAADLVVDIGPGAGVHGGEIVAQGSAEQIAAEARSLTGQYLCGARRIAIPSERRPNDPARQLRILGAQGNNLRAVDASIPVGTFCCITGVSGSGKSTLINDTLHPVIARHLNGSSLQPAKHAADRGPGTLRQGGRHRPEPHRSHPALQPGDLHRALQPGARPLRQRPRGPLARLQLRALQLQRQGRTLRGVQRGRLIRVEMHFLPDIYVQCDTCKGRRYNRETLEIRYKGKTIDEVLNLTVEDALSFFAPVPVIHRKLQTLMDVGLSYVTLGQSATTLSGGEAQRVKLSRELSKRDTGRTLYILDEPTTGLHFHDVKHLLDVLHRFRDQGNTVVVIEHNLDVIKTADWIIDLGPEGGDKGGEIIGVGTPEEIAANARSHTGRFLGPLLERGW